MHRIFFKYRSVIINGIILLSLLIAMILKDGNVKNFFLGLGTGGALVIFGQSLENARSKEINKHLNLTKHKN